LGYDDNFDATQVYEEVKDVAKQHQHNPIALSTQVDKDVGDIRLAKVEGNVKAATDLP
jgi:hypothetical protein